MLGFAIIDGHSPVVDVGASSAVEFVHVDRIIVARSTDVRFLHDREILIDFILLANAGDVRDDGWVFFEFIAQDALVGFAQPAHDLHRLSFGFVHVHQTLAEQREEQEHTDGRAYQNQQRVPVVAFLLGI